jgi:hypothetical protein
MMGFCETLTRWRIRSALAAISSSATLRTLTLIVGAVECIERLSISPAQAMAACVIHLSAKRLYVALRKP